MASNLIDLTSPEAVKAFADAKGAVHYNMYGSGGDRLLGVVSFPIFRTGQPFFLCGQPIIGDDLMLKPEISDERNQCVLVSYPQ